MQQTTIMRPRRARLDASTGCQLRCPGCSTTAGFVKQNLGTGSLRYSNFEAFLDENPRVKSIELANWGEIFLNTDLPKMIRLAFERGVRLSAETGANLNHISDECVEALVKWQFGTLVVSIDGATPDTYRKYRIGGELDRVLENVERINAAKRRRRSQLPLLVWQFVVFEHNRHEVDMARKTAERLRMGFYTKPNTSIWEAGSLSEERSDSGQPMRMEKTPRASTRKGLVASVRKQIKGAPCLQLWEQPQISWNGTVTGCNCNAGELGNYGNAFEDGFDEVVNGARMQTARSMLMGKIPPQAGIPCTACPKFGIRVQTENYVTPLQIGIRRVFGRLGHWLLHFPGLYLKTKTWFSRKTRLQI